MNSILHTPWSDEITLIWVESGQAASGFESRMEHRSTPPLMCDWEDGVSQSEFYQSMKAGVAATAQAEVNTADYLDFWPAGFTGTRFAEFKGNVMNNGRIYSEFVLLTGNYTGIEAMGAYTDGMRIAYCMGDKDLYEKLSDTLGKRVATRSTSPALYMIFREEGERYVFYARENFSTRLVTS